MLKYYFKNQFWSKVEKIVVNKDFKTDTFITKSNLFKEDFKGYNKTLLIYFTLENANRILEGKISVFHVDYKLEFPLQRNKD